MLKNHTCRSFLLIALLAAMSCFSPQGYAQNSKKVFYVDSFEGKDKHSGTSPEQAWKSLEKVNQTVFEPGSMILFKSNGLWSGQLHPKGSGIEGQPIIIDRYGDGQKPIIDGGGMTGEGVVRLFNQSYWEINNLEISNFAPSPGDRRGVEVKAENAGLIRHIHLRNLTVHDIPGKVGNDLEAKKTAGIYVAVVGDDQRATGFDDVRIEGCEIYNVENQGIVTNNEVKHSDYPGTDDWHKRKFTNLVVRNNVIHHISKNAMIIRLSEGGIVEHNLCYETALGITGNTMFSRSARNTVFQFNEGFSNKSIDYDGSMYDPDLSSPGTVWQYSYSHNNAHGLAWICTSKADRDLVIRHNVSYNDHGNIFYVNYPLRGAHIHHNHVYVGENRYPVILRENPNNRHTYVFDNNTIIDPYGNSRFVLALGEQANSQDRTIIQNIYMGQLPDSNSDEPFYLSQRILHEGGTVQSASPVYMDLDARQNSRLYDNLKEIGTVNGVRLTDMELKDELVSLRGEVFAHFNLLYKPDLSKDFWERQFNEERPIDHLLEKALHNLVRKKVQQAVLIEKGLIGIDKADQSVFLNRWNNTNAYRLEAKEAGAILYGPVTYSQSQLREYELLNDIILLKDLMDGEEIDTAEEVLEAYYNQHPNLFNSRNRYDSYEENKAAVKIYLIDEKYDELIDKLVENAIKDLDMDKVKATLRQQVW